MVPCAANQSEDRLKARSALGADLAALSQICSWSRSGSFKPDLLLEQIWQL